MSDAVSDIAEISPVAIASAVISLPGASVSSADSWWNWRATIERDGEWLQLAMTLMGDDEDLWGGFVVDEVSDPSILADVAESLSATIEGIWLHSADCRMWKPNRFRSQHCRELGPQR